MNDQKLRKAFHLLVSKLHMQKLRSSDDELKTIYHCIEGTKKRIYGDDERKGFQAIENLRDYYSSSEELLTMIDYGFGDPNDKRTNEEMSEGVVIKKRIKEFYTASSQRKNAEFMFRIIRAFKPRLCVELGTCLGVSTAYGSLAVSLNEVGQFISLEGAKELANTAEKNLKKFGFKNYSIKVGQFQNTLPLLLDQSQEIDFAFIDGHHEENATLRYFDWFYPKLATKAVLVFDDINWSKGMQNAWKKLKNDARVKWTIDHYHRGVCFIDKSKVWNSNGSNFRVWF